MITFAAEERTDRTRQHPSAYPTNEPSKTETYKDRIMMKQTMHKSTTSAIWLAAVAVIALVAKPTSAWAQNPKTFTEYVNEII